MRRRHAISQPIVQFGSVTISESFRQPFANGRTFDFTIDGTITYPDADDLAVFDAGTDLKPYAIELAKRGAVRLAESNPATY